MVENDKSEVGLAKECDNFQMRENQSLGTNSRMGGYEQATTTSIFWKINIMDRLAYEEVDRYLDKHLEVDVAEAVTTYITHREDEFEEPDREAIREL